MTPSRQQAPPQPQKPGQCPCEEPQLSRQASPARSTRGGSGGGKGGGMAGGEGAAAVQQCTPSQPRCPWEHCHGKEEEEAAAREDALARWQHAPPHPQKSVGHAPSTPKHASRQRIPTFTTRGGRGGGGEGGLGGGDGVGGRCGGWGADGRGGGSGDTGGVKGGSGGDGGGDGLGAFTWRPIAESQD